MQTGPERTRGGLTLELGEVSEASRLRERALILAALNQVDPSTWTSRAASSVVAPARGLDDSTVSGPLLDRPLLPGPDTFPGYTILREVHRGGQGVVYLATQQTTRRRVAVKVIHGGATLGPTGRARFEREVQLLGQLNHPNIVKLHDSGVTSDGSLFYVMDYVSGRALDDVLREQRRRFRVESSRARSRAEGLDSVDGALRFFAKICDGVNAAHLRGVIHRDIKPANVRVDEHGEPVLVDFGLAKVSTAVGAEPGASAPMTLTGQFVGSLPWASPEQAAGAGESIDLRSDVYSLGVMLYQMLTGGQFPYAVSGNMRDVLDNIQRADPEPPSNARRQINNEVETIVLKAIAKEKDRRYQSAGELARDVRRYLRGEPIEAKRDAGWYVIRKTLNRHRVAATCAAAVCLLVTGSAVAMTAMWRQSDAARAVAVAQRDRAEDNLAAVRDLANTFLYDFNDAIANLRGATRARETVLAKALEYLEILAAQPDHGPAALASLADAHERIGDLYGALNSANLGSSAKAAEHYSAALEIRQRLAVAFPDDPHHKSALARTWERIGESRIKHEDFSSALEAYEWGRRFAEQADDTPARLALATRVADAHRRLAEGMRDDPQAFAARMDLAASMYAQADAGWAALDAPESPRRRAILVSKQAQTLLQRAAVATRHNDLEAAGDLIGTGAEMIGRVLPRFEAMLAASPADYQTARDLWVVVHYLGQAHFEAAEVHAGLGDDEAARRAREEALATFTRLHALAESLATDESNIEAQRDLGVSTNKLGNTLSALGRLDEARDAFERNVVLWKGLYASDPVERHLRDLGVGQHKVAETDERLADHAETEAERVALLRLAQAGYQTAEATFRQFETRGGDAARLLRSVRESLDRVAEKLGG